MRADSKLWPALLLAGCGGPQSALDPAGPSAAAIHLLGLIMYVGAALVTLLVTVLMLVPFLRRRERTANRKLFLWGGGVALPLLTLSALVPYVLTLGHGTRASAAADRLVVDVTGQIYWWEMSPPLTGANYSPGINTDVWVLGLGFVEIAAVAAAVELIVGILKTRAPGMALGKMPIFAWYMLVTAGMIMIGMPAVIAADILLELERAFGMPFYDPTRGG